MLKRRWEKTPRSGINCRGGSWNDANLEINRVGFFVVCFFLKLTLQRCLLFRRHFGGTDEYAQSSSIWNYKSGGKFSSLLLSSSLWACLSTQIVPKFMVHKLHGEWRSSHTSSSTVTWNWPAAFAVSAAAAWEHVVAAAASNGHRTTPDSSPPPVAAGRTCFLMRSDASCWLTGARGENIYPANKGRGEPPAGLHCPPLCCP